VYYWFSTAYFLIFLHCLNNIQYQNFKIWNLFLMFLFTYLFFYFISYFFLIIIHAINFLKMLKFWFCFLFYSHCKPHRTLQYLKLSEIEHRLFDYCNYDQFKIGLKNTVIILKTTRMQKCITLLRVN